MFDPSPLEFSFLFDTELIGNAPKTVSFQANEQQRRLLAKRFGIEEIASLAATLTVRKINNKGIFGVAGTFVSDVVQSCVVSLEPVPSHIEEAIDVRFVSDLDSNPMEFVDLEYMDEDPPEPVVDGHLELGELVAQYLSLALDPYPRADGVEDRLWHGDPPDKPEKRENPFAALAALKKEKK